MPRLSFKIRIPFDPERQKVVLVGTDRALGDWQPTKGLHLTPEGSGIYGGAVDVPYGVLEFKITRGSWATESVHLDGTPAPNAHYLIAHDLTLELEVEHWKDVPVRHSEEIFGKAIDCELDATLFQESRRVCVWLPPGYMQSDSSRHPVLYLLNGQESLHALEAPDRDSLRADQWVRQLVRAKLLPELILVAAFLPENASQRDFELSPQCDGPKLADFLVHDVKPFIDYTFCRDRTLSEPADTGALGGGLSGTLALFMALRHASTFGQFACLSPAYQDLSADRPADSWLLEQIRQEPDLRPNRRIYFDHGTLGSDAETPDFQPVVNSLLESRGFAQERDFRVLKAEGTQPALCSWRARLGAPLQFLFGPAIQS